MPDWSTCTCRRRGDAGRTSFARDERCFHSFAGPRCRLSGTTPHTCLPATCAACAACGLCSRVRGTQAGTLIDSTPVRSLYGGANFASVVRPIPAGPGQTLPGGCFRCRNTRNKFFAARFAPVLLRVHTAAKHIGGPAGIQQKFGTFETQRITSLETPKRRTKKESSQPLRHPRRSRRGSHRILRPNLLRVSMLLLAELLLQLAEHAERRRRDARPLRPVQHVAPRHNI